MSDFWFYIKLGLEHVLDWNAYDHTLFIIALCASHTVKTWRRMVLLVTFFTLGHSVSLALAVYKVVAVPSDWVEFLIPVTILATALVSIINAFRKRLSNAGLYFTILTFFFGMVHGFGFAGYFNMINEGAIFVHLLEFALGIEIAQVIIASFVVMLGYVAQELLKLKRQYWVVTLSAVVLILAIPMLMENWIF
ncbi:HupE/UreJ family protein [Rasiella rasia]|uniref:HupE/UreJ family protein n=1 Tax=Rasiella rasia TaxID=2744027 RepID=A0A6G6GMG4_9FLAO|nr:HupE/UreJ family protein [Rasiella rasia]QIE59714.1 HupE/UreJ family protein [Rasiella rasia]